MDKRDHLDNLARETAIAIAGANGVVTTAVSPDDAAYVVGKIHEVLGSKGYRTNLIVARLRNEQVPKTYLNLGAPLEAVEEDDEDNRVVH